MKIPKLKTIQVDCYDLEEISLYIEDKLGLEQFEALGTIRKYLEIKDNTIEGIYQLIIEDEVLDYAYPKMELKIFETIIDDFGGHILIDELPFYDKEEIE